MKRTLLINSGKGRREQQPVEAQGRANGWPQRNRASPVSTKAAAAGVGVRWQRCSHITALVACFESLTFTPATGGAWLRTCGISTAKAEVIPVDRQAIKTRNIAACLRNMAAAVEGHAVFLSAGLLCAAAVNAVPPKEISSSKRNGRLVHRSY